MYESHHGEGEQNSGKLAQPLPKRCVPAQPLDPQVADFSCAAARRSPCWWTMRAQLAQSADAQIGARRGWSDRLAAESARRLGSAARAGQMCRATGRLSAVALRAQVRPDVPQECASPRATRPSGPVGLVGRATLEHCSGAIVARLRPYKAVPRGADVPVGASAGQMSLLVRTRASGRTV